MVKRNGSGRRLTVSADGMGVVSHAGVGMLQELAGATGLVHELDTVLVDTYRGVPQHAPGRVLTDLAVAVADGADVISGIGCSVTGRTCSVNCCKCSWWLAWGWLAGLALVTWRPV